MLLSTYCCHPSLANDNLSGIAVLTMVAKELAQRELRHTYRFVFAPGTIGPLSWLHCNRDRLDRVVHGLSVSCIGDAGDHTYKRSKDHGAAINRAVETVLRDSGKPFTLEDWEPWGGDERQFNSPGFNLPVGTLMRTPHGGFDGYHTSADNLDRISPDSLEESVQTCLDVIDVLETNRTMINLSPYGEPQLGKRGLYRVGRRRRLLTGRRARAAVGPQPERRQREHPRHRRSFRHRISRSSGARRSGSSRPISSPLRRAPSHAADAAISATTRWSSTGSIARP